MSYYVIYYICALNASKMRQLWACLELFNAGGTKMMNPHQCGETEAPEVRLALCRDPLMLSEVVGHLSHVLLCESEDFGLLACSAGGIKRSMTMYDYLTPIQSITPVTNELQYQTDSTFTDFPTCHVPLGSRIPLTGSTRPRSHKTGPPWPISWHVRNWLPSLLLPTSLVTPWPSGLPPGYGHPLHPASRNFLNDGQFWSGA